jgi:hypothetical protein
VRRLGAAFWSRELKESESCDRSQHSKEAKLHLPQKDINVVSRLVARTLHFLKPPVASLTRYLKSHRTVTAARVSIVLVANPGNDRSLKSELLFFYLRSETVDLEVVPVFLLTTFNQQFSLALNHC